MKLSILQMRNMILILISSIFLGTILIFAAYSIPTDRIYTNMQKSAVVYAHEGDAPRWGGVVHTRLDNFTTSIMIMKAAYPIKERGGGKSCSVKSLVGNKKKFSCSYIG